MAYYQTKDAKARIEQRLTRENQKALPAANDDHNNMVTLALPETSDETVRYELTLRRLDNDEGTVIEAAIDNDKKEAKPEAEETGLFASFATMFD